MAIPTEQLIFIRSSLDASGYVAGAAKVTDANEKISASGDRVVGTTARTTRAMVDSGSAFDRYRRQIDPVVAAEQKLEQVRGAAQRALSAGRTDQEAHNATVAAYARRLEEARAAGDKFSTTTTSLARSSRQASDAFRTFSIQIPDVIQGALTGQSAFQLLVQQGLQTVQVLQVQGGILSGLKSIFATLVSPIGLAVAATVAFVGGMTALGLASEMSARRMVTLQNALRATRSDYVNLAQEVNAAAKAVAASSQIGTSDARAAGVSIAGSTGFSGDQAELERLIKLSGDLAAVMGTDIPEAGKKMAAGLTDPAKVAQELADKTFPGVSQQLARTIDLMQKSGNLFGAQRLLVDAYRNSVEGAAGPHTELQKALSALSNLFTEAGQSGKSFAENLGAFVTHAATTALNQIVALMNAAKEFRAWVDGLPARVKEAMPELPSWMGGPGSQQTAVSSAGALGAMQVMPRTIGMYRNPITDEPLNPLNLSDNVAGAMQYIRELARGGQSQDVISGSYNQGPTGFLRNPSVSEGYRASVRSASAANVPRSTAAMIEYWGSVLQMSPELIDLGKRISMVENRGLQGPATSTAPSVGVGAGNEPSVGVGRGNDAFGPPRSPTQQAAINAADKASQGLIAGQREAIKAQIDGYRELEKSGLDYSEVIKKLQGDLDSLLTPMQQLDKSLRDQAALSGVAEGAAREYATALQQANDVAVKQGDGALQVADRLRVLQSVHDRLAGQYKQEISDIARRTAANDNFNSALAESIKQYGSYTAAAQHLANAEKAKESVRKTTMESEAEYASRLDETTRALDRETQSLNARNLQPQLDQQRQSIDLLEAQTSAIGMSADEYEKYVAVFQAKQKLERDNIPIQDELAQKYLENVARISDLTSAYRHQTQSLSAVTDILSNAFDRLAQSLVDAFVSGQGHAVNFANVMKGVVASIITELLKLAVINPILNSFLPSTNGLRPTLDAAFGGGGMMGLLGQGQTLVGASDMLGLTNVGGWLKGQLGFSQGAGSMWSQIGNAGIFGTSTIEAAQPLIMAAGGYNAGPLMATGGAEATGMFGGASLGGVASTLGGIGGGFAVGQMAGGFVQNAMGKTGPGPSIGAGVGAGVGAIFGPVGSLVGGLIGGAAGGLFGPGQPNSFSMTGLGVENGRLTAGASANQGFGSNRDEVVQQLQAINATLDQSGIKIADINLPDGKSFQVGRDEDRPDLQGSSMAAASLAELFSKFTFAANDPVLAGFLSGKTFGDPNQLTQFVQRFHEVQAAIGDLLTNVSPQLVAFGNGTAEVVGTLNEQIAAIQQQFTAASDAAWQYMNSGMATEAQIRDLTQAQVDLAAASEKAAAAVRLSAFAAADDQINVMYLETQKLRAARTGDLAAQRDIALQESARNQWLQLSGLYNQFQTTYGTNWTENVIAQYQRAQGQIEELFGEQRLAIQQEYADRLLAAQQQQADNSLAQHLQNIQTLAAQNLEIYARNVRARVSLGQEDPQVAALWEFDARAQQEREQLRNQLIGMFGDAYQAHEDYATRMTALDQALGLERWALQKQFGDQQIAQQKAQQEEQARIRDQATAAASNSISSITDYISSLSVGNMSPLSPMAQAQAANDNFYRISSQASMGDPAGLSQFTSSAGRYLEANRQAYGSSGAQYVQAFDRVAEAAAQIGQLNPDTLTATFMAKTMETQTQTLVGELRALRDEVTRMANDARLNARQPVREAA